MNQNNGLYTDFGYLTVDAKAVPKPLEAPQCRYLLATG